MRYLLDTQLVLWAAVLPERIPPSTRRLLSSPRNELLFSAASIWEVTIKYMRGRKDFNVDPRILRRGLLDNGYAEIPVTSLHAVGVASLPLLHGDPFDRILIAQAIAEGVTLLSADSQLSRYGPAVRNA